MYLNNLIDKEDTLTEVEKIRVMKYPEDFVEVAEDGSEKKKRTGPVVRYGDVVRAIEGTTPAIYKMKVQEVDELNRMAGTYRPEDKQQPYTPEGTNKQYAKGGVIPGTTEYTAEPGEKIRTLDEMKDELMSGVKISKIKDCTITVNISKGGKE